MRALKVLQNELWLRRIPHSAVCPQFLWSNSPLIKANRDVFLSAKPGWPRPAYLAVEMILWVKWVGFFGWLAMFSALRRFGDTARDEMGISVPRQFLRLLRTTFWACLPPGDAYRFGMISHPDRLWNYVSDHHIATYHAWRNRSLGVSPVQISKLGDKVETSETLQSQGISMAPILASVTVGEKPKFDLLATLKSNGRLFCKTRGGNRGLGAFECWYKNGEISGRRFEKGSLEDESAVLQAWNELLQRGEAMVQPLLQNHPHFDLLVNDSRAITLRCVTKRSDDRENAEHNVLCASLEIPMERKPGNKRDGYVILPIDIITGKFIPLSESTFCHPDTRKAHADMLQRIDVGLTLPDWNELTAQSKVAHTEFSDIWAIAWDWVLTPKGPVLLEGNSGFGGNMPQIMSGGFWTTFD